MEYPDSLGQQASDQATTVNEGLDPGHRHFSPMLWLYPASLQPGAGATQPTGGAYGGAEGGGDGSNTQKSQSHVDIYEVGQSNADL